MNQFKTTCFLIYQCHHSTFADYPFPSSSVYAGLPQFCITSTCSTGEHI